MRLTNYLIVLLVLLGFSSCKNKKKIVESKENKTPEVVVNETVEEVLEEEQEFVPEPREYNENIIIGIEKTPCFGTCPVFKLYVFNDYTIEFHGIANISPLGLYTGKANEELVNQVFSLANKINYFGLNNIYSKPITDVPTVYSTLLLQGKRKSIINHFMGPDELTEFENYVVMLFKDKATTPLGDKK